MCEKCDKMGWITYQGSVPAPFGSGSVVMESSEYCDCVLDGQCPNCGEPCEWDEENECPVVCSACGWNVDEGSFETIDYEVESANEENTDLDAHEKSVLSAMIAYEAETNCAITIDKLAEVMNKAIAEVDWIVNNLVEKKAVTAFDKSERYTKTLYYVNEEKS